MKVKFVNEDIKDFLKPKSSIELLKELTANSLTPEMRNDLNIEMKNEKVTYDLNCNEYEYEDYELFIMLLAQDYLNSSLEVYLPDKRKVELYDLFKKGFNIATYFLDEDDVDIDNIPNFKNIIEPYGWQEFWHEDNYGQHEWIFVKPPSNKI